MGVTYCVVLDLTKNVSKCLNFCRSHRVISGLIKSINQSINQIFIPVSLACTQPAPISGVVKVGPGRMAKAGCLSRSCHTISHEMCMSVRLAVCLCVTSMIKVALIVETSRSFRVTKVFVRVTSMVEIVCEISGNLILILYRNRDFSFYLCEKKKEKRDQGYESVCTCNFNGRDCL